MTPLPQLAAATGGPEWWTGIPVQFRIVVYIWSGAIVAAKLLPWLLRTCAGIAPAISNLLADALLYPEYVTTRIRRARGRAPGPVAFTYGAAIEAATSAVGSVGRTAASSQLLRTRRLRIWPLLLIASAVIAAFWRVPDMAVETPSLRPVAATLTDLRSPFISLDELVTTGHLTAPHTPLPSCPTTKSMHHKKKSRHGNT